MLTPANRTLPVGAEEVEEVVVVFNVVECTVVVVVDVVLAKQQTVNGEHFLHPSRVTYPRLEGTESTNCSGRSSSTQRHMWLPQSIPDHHLRTVTLAFPIDHR